jgi:hypothetical protein
MKAERQFGQTSGTCSMRLSGTTSHDCEAALCHLVVHLCAVVKVIV